MSTITFDTLQYVDTLTSAGVPEAQAKAMAKAQAQAIDSASDIKLATKSDVSNIREDIRKVENELSIQRFMLGATLAGVGAIVMKLFFMH